MMLAEMLGVAHVAPGDLFRNHQRQGTPLGLKSIEYMSHGLLVPDDITIAMVMERILPPLCEKGFLLDGFPRNPVQARALDEALAARGQELSLVFLMKVSEEELVSRLNGRLVCRQCEAPYHREAAPPGTLGRCDLCSGELYQREDDMPEAVRVRIQVYQEETEPLVQYYSKAGKLVDVDGRGSVDKVGQRLLAGLKR